MSVTQTEINEIPRCRVCGERLVVTPSRFVACPESLEHTRLTRCDEDDVSRLERVTSMARLPVAHKVPKKHAIYRCNGEEYGRVRINDGTHWEGEIVAREEHANGWIRIRLVPLPKTKVVNNNNRQLWD